METYKKDQEYTLKVVNTDNEIKEIKYTPNKDMSKPEMIMALKSKYKNFFKLMESKDTYTSYEEPYDGKHMTKAQWKKIYDKEIEHNKDNGGWETFEDWWRDMTEKDRLIVKESIEDDNKKVKIVRKAIEDKLRQNGYNLTYDDINLETDNNGEIHVYDKLTGDEVLVVTQDMLRNILTEATSDNSVIVISYGRGMRFPDRETAIEYYKECIAGTDPDGAENYAYQNILDMLVSTDELVVYDWDDRTEYDWWVQKGKPTDDISDELLKAHLGENKRMKKEDLSDKDIKELDEYTDNEIKKMYDKYCSENKNKKSFEDWQKENVDSALVNELEYEFFSNRKKTEDLEVDEKTFLDGFVGQPLSMVLTYLGDGHDIADRDYDSVVFFPPVDEIDDTDNYDLYVQGLSQVLKVVDRFDADDINIIVDITDYVKKNKDTLLDLFEVDGETEEEIMEDLVCRVMPNVISGYTTDDVYKLLLNTINGGK